MFCKCKNFHGKKIQFFVSTRIVFLGWTNQSNSIYIMGHNNSPLNPQLLICHTASLITLRHLMKTIWGNKLKKSREASLINILFLYWYAEASCNSLTTKLNQTQGKLLIVTHHIIKSINDFTHSQSPSQQQNMHSISYSMVFWTVLSTNNKSIFPLWQRGIWIFECNVFSDE